ncbi:MAG: DUF1800 domain-containing protein [Candidatus Eremiobacteraeota bacterium]|nr:DUF1800 domain-containing protein [Candidatus Eremiobacteraeota bacterium]
MAAAAPAFASEPTFATTFVSSVTPRGAAGSDGGVDVRGGRYLRVTASGTLVLGYGACPRATGPQGCTAAFSPARSAANSPTGALIAAFADASGVLVSSWTAIGDAAYVAIPADAARVLFRVNGSTGREFGAFHVVADVVNARAGRAVQGVAVSAVAPSATRHTQPVMRGVATGGLSSRADVQHLLRRFGFSDTPANVTAVYRGGAGAWLAQQLNPDAIDDSALATYMEPMPLAGTSPQTMNGYDDYRFILERRIVQREVASKRQLLEKMTLHWLEHFAVSEDKVNSPSAMIHYEETLRTDALGNFKTLVSDVTVEPAMLLWLDNNNNDGSHVATSPPNENFSRELMQLYVLGTTQLHADGTPILDGTGNPLPSYTDEDVKQVAQSLTGFQRTEPYPLPLADPRTIDGTKFFTTRHAKGPFTIIGQSVTDTGDPTIVGKVVGVLASNPATAPFEVKELLQRFVTESPSTGYVSRIVAVWNANVDAPDQLAKVMQAIASDPEFYADKQSMVKEPIEYTIDAIRALNGAQAVPVTASMRTPYGSVRIVLSGMQEQHWYPPSVFSFYRPGEKESLLTNSLLLTRWGEAVALSNNAMLATLCAKCDVNLDFTSLQALAGGTSAAAVTGYLMDALVDGGTPELSALVQNYLGSNGTTNIKGAVWLVLTSPEYEVN